MTHLKPRSPEFIDLGICVDHDQACAVYHTEGVQPAVIELNTGVFQPSWKAQQEGWRLVQAKTKFQRWLIEFFFSW